MTAEFWIRIGEAFGALMGVAGVCWCAEHIGRAYLTNRLVRNARGHEDWLTVRTALRRGR